MNSIELSGKIYIGIISVILPLSYMYFINKYKDIPVSKLWGKTPKYLQNLTSLSIFIMAIAYLYLYYYIFVNKYNMNYVMSYTGFILFSFLWMPFTYEYILNKNTLNKNIIILTLFLVAAFAGMIIRDVYYSGYKKDIKYNLAIISSSYIFFHTFFLDFITWSYYFFK